MKRLSILITASLLAVSICLPAWGAEPTEPRVITLEEAQAMALKASYGLQIQEQSVIRAEEARKQGVDTADALRLSQGASWVADSYAKNALVGLQSATNNLAIAQRQTEIEKELLAFTVRAQFDAVRTTKAQLNVLRI